MNDLVSIIVPVYNAEKNLSRCLNSILQQSYQRLEIILINDGSADQSGKICSEYAKSDDRIVVLHQANAGPSIARNNGINMATGKYLQFVDADDYLEHDMTEKMIAAIKNSQLVICGYKSQFTKDDFYEIDMSPSLIGKYNKADFLNHFSELYQDGMIPSIWNKLYNRQVVVVNRIRFNENINMGEDLLFNLTYFKKCHSIFLIPGTLYHYEISDDTSLSRAFNLRFIERQEMLHQETKHFLVEQNSDSSSNMDLLSSIYAVSIINGLNNLFHYDSQLTASERKRHIREIIERKSVAQNLPYFKGSKQLSLMRKLIQAQAVNRIYLFFKLKNMIYLKAPSLFSLIKRFNQKD